jgi:hypothetical protein
MAIAVRSSGSSPVAPSQTFEVETVSGETLDVMTEGEQRWYQQTRDSYLEQTAFDAASDLADLDRLLLMELLVHRWSVWIARGSDYEKEEVDASKLQKQIADNTSNVTKLKSAMGLTKAARDAAANAGSVAEYVTSLLSRAKMFGVHREEQVGKAIALLQEIFSLIGTYDRSDEEERRKIGLETPEDILQWIREIAEPEFSQLDKDFVEGNQRFWVRQI